MWRSEARLMGRFETLLMGRSDSAVRRARAGAVLAAALLVSACASAPRLAGSPTLLEYSGRFSVSWRTDVGDSTTQRSAGRFLLRVDGPRSELEVSSPLGQTLAVANVAPGAASLVTANGARFDAADAQALTEQAFGWPAPLAQLPQWLSGASRGAGVPAGSPAPDGRGTAGTTNPPAMQATRFVDSNWQVSIEAWQKGAPKRLVLSWPAVALPESAPGATPALGANGEPKAAERPLAREVELRLVVDEAPGDAGLR